jgi:hypothetical protein
MKLWRLKWNVLRLVAAATHLWVVAADTDARLARLAYASLPDFDFVSEVSFLRQSGRLGEAVMIAEEGLRTLPEGSAERSSLERELAKTRAEQESVLRRVREVGFGAISGKGDSIESLIGAIGADFFIVGDLRDIVIQSGRYVLDGETDEVVLILSGVGLATTVVPEVDWVPAVLKSAKKAGALTKGLSKEITQLAKRGGGEALTALFKDVRTIARKASPGGATRILRHADNADELATLARFVDKTPAGAFALHVTGKEGAAMVKSGARAQSRAAKAAALTGEEAVVLAAKKGQPGLAWLRTGGAKALTRPHFLVGIGKAIWKGNAEAAAARLAAILDPRARWLVPALGAWVFLELALLARALWPARPARALAPA